MTTNTISSNNAATAVHAQQQAAAKRKPSTVDFAKLVANAGGDIKTDTNTATKQNSSASVTAVAQNADGSKISS